MLPKMRIIHSSIAPSPFSVWSATLNLFEVQRLMPLSVASLSYAWMWFKGTSDFSALWHLALFATVWSFWWERNNMGFKNQRETPKQVSYRVKAKCAAWASSLPKCQSFYIFDISQAWKECIGCSSFWFPHVVKDHFVVSCFRSRFVSLGTSWAFLLFMK